jgi:hypothetical protein
MRRFAGLVVAGIGLVVLPGCQCCQFCHFSLWRTALCSVYNSYGDGYSADRMVNFNDRYDEQTREAAEYYREHPEDSEGNVALFSPEGSGAASVMR